MPKLSDKGVGGQAKPDRADKSYFEKAFKENQKYHKMLVNQIHIHIHFFYYLCLFKESL